MSRVHDPCPNWFTRPHAVEIRAKIAGANIRLFEILHIIKL